MKLRQARKVMRGVVREWGTFVSFGSLVEVFRSGASAWRVGTMRRAAQRLAMLGGIMFGFVAPSSAAYDICLIEQGTGDYLSLANVFDSGTCSSLVGPYGGVGYYFGSSLVVGADVSMGGSRICYGTGGPVVVATWKDCEMVQGQMSASGGEDVFFLLTELTTVLGGGLPERPLGSEGTSGGGGGGSGLFDVDLTGIQQDLLFTGTFMGSFLLLWLGYRKVVSMVRARDPRLESWGL